MPHGRAFNILFFVSVLTSLPSWSRASDVGSGAQPPCAGSSGQNFNFSDICLACDVCNSTLCQICSKSLWVPRVRGSFA
eukprot:6188256-Amphidinium_carterae.1